jgi:bifunctional DNA-binding transcriptional regulator/antitoxin component of YhaV-PrlF toxin-antitoxin module
MVKVQKGSGTQHLVTIPEELRKAMGWEKGDELSFEVKDSETLEVSKK